ncbi:MAG: hypothetical protein NTW08_01890 [Gammaproteobacteria bacterium]|nr:hypothetical protein [Gammaproteobacteria bacterium]
MQETKSYAAQKDLISFAIMSEYGGHYFDCTTTFTNAHFPPVDDFKITLPLKCQEMRGEHEPLYGTDIWAFASSKPGHPLFTTTLEETLKILDRPKNELGRSWSDDQTSCTACDFANTWMELYIDDLNISWLKEHSWTDESTNSEHLLPEIGLEKFNTGLWRRKENEAPPSDEEDRINRDAFLKLDLVKPDKIDPPDQHSANKDSQTHSP